MNCDPVDKTSKILSVLILTRNEEAHLARCLESARQLSSSIFVLDSHSNDKTVDIARAEGVGLISGEFDTFSDKLNWGLENINFETPWVMRLDADEVLSDGLISELPTLLSKLETSVSGIFVRRQIWFLGSWMRFGGMYPTYSVRVMRPKAVFCEARELDEHMILRYGRFVRLEKDIMDIPLSNLSDWISKHNKYSSLEAAAIMKADSGVSGDAGYMNLFGSLPQRVRWIKNKIFYRLPLFVRPLIYFVYRYFFRFGFLDGRKGLVFHFLHGFWYRFLIDAKILEMRYRFRSGSGNGRRR